MSRFISASRNDVLKTLFGERRMKEGREEGRKEWEEWEDERDERKGERKEQREELNSLYFRLIPLKEYCVLEYPCPG
jgi:hypothetical protein